MNIKIAYLCMVPLLTTHLAASSDTPEARPPAANRLIGELQDIVHTLEADNPDLLKSFTETDRKKVLKAFITSFEGGVKLETENSDRTGEEPDKIYKAFSLSKNSYLYTRLDSITPQSIEDMQLELASYIGREDEKQGCIVDLRSCSGHNIPGAIQLLQTVRNTKKDHKQIALTVLIGENTSGSAEILAKMIDHEQLGMTIGGETAGNPLPERKLELNSGATIKLAKSSKYVSPPEIKPLQPRLKIQKHDQVSYDTLYSTMDGEKADNCLSRAIDLMISINIMQ